MHTSIYRCGFNCNGICSLAEFAVGAPLISWKACPQRSLRTAKPSTAFSLVHGELHRSCLRCEFVRRERMSGNALARACMVSVPWSCQVDASVSIVVSHPRSHDRRCGVDPTTVSPAPPLSPSSPQNLAYAFDRSRERREGTVAPRAQRTLGAARPPLGASQLRMLGRWRHDTHGDHPIALREVICAHPFP
jgi:hypothetical protein